METWWPVDQTFWWGVVGGGLGTVLGVGGAIVGGYLLPRGRGYRRVMSGIVAVGLVGLLCALAGVAAIADDQPYWVYDPLLLIGCAVYWVAVGLLPGIDMAYRTVLANRSTGTNDLELRGRFAVGWASAVVREDWQPRGRYGKWVNPLIAAHGTDRRLDRSRLGWLAASDRRGVRGVVPWDDGRFRVPVFGRTLVDGQGACDPGDHEIRRATALGCRGTPA